MSTVKWTKIKELRSMTPEQINERYEPSKVAQGLADKLCLKGQRVEPRRPKTEAEKRRAIAVGRLALMIAGDRVRAGRLW